MDLVTALAGIALLAGGLISFAWYVFGRESDHLAGMYRAAALDWPRGVQEDDPPPAWSWRTTPPRGGAEPHVARPNELPPRTAVAAQVRRGSSRRDGRW